MEGSQQNLGTGEGSKPRQATKYHVLIVGDVPDRTEPERVGETHRVQYEALTNGNGHPIAFEGFKREDVLIDVLEGDYGLEADENGKSPYLVIVPVRGFVKLRGTIETRKHVTLED